MSVNSMQFRDDHVLYIASDKGTIFKTKSDGSFAHIDESQAVNNVPATMVLYQNFPNPFNPSTTIKYNLQKSGKVNLKVFNLSGQEIETLEDDFQSADNHEIMWQPKGLPNGIYFYRLEFDKFSEIKKLILQK